MATTYNGHTQHVYPCLHWWCHHRGLVIHYYNLVAHSYTQSYNKLSILRHHTMWKAKISTGRRVGTSKSHNSSFNMLYCIVQNFWGTKLAWLGHHKGIYKNISNTLLLQLFYPYYAKMSANNGMPGILNLGRIFWVRELNPFIDL